MNAIFSHHAFETTGITSAPSFDFTEARMDNHRRANCGAECGFDLTLGRRLRPEKV